MPFDAKMEHNILNRIGDTPLVRLGKLVPDGCAKILLKIEAENPTGSMKDRMALQMIEAAERDGRLTKGQPVVEYTGGSTGVSLSLVCSVKGYPLHIVTSDAFSQEKRAHMRALGTTLTIVPSDGGGMDEALTRNMIAAADEVRVRSGAFWTDQLNNADQIPAYHKMGEEIWLQTGGTVDAYVQSVGTAASVRGVSEALTAFDPNIHRVAVEPAESAVLSGQEGGVHRIEGVGAGFIVPLWKPDVIDEIATVSTDEAMKMARNLAKTEGIFAGTSTGANLCVAIDIGKRLGPAATVVTLMCDTGIKYLSTPLYNAG